MSEIRKYTTNLENSGLFCEVVLYSDHLAAMEEKAITEKDWKRLNRVFKSTSDKTIDQDIEIERLKTLINGEDDYVAWLRWTGDESHRHVVVCDSDSEGAFKVYRKKTP